MKDKWGIDENMGSLGVRGVTREQDTLRRGTDHILLLNFTPSPVVQIITSKYVFLFISKARYGRGADSSNSCFIKKPGMAHSAAKNRLLKPLR